MFLFYSLCLLLSVLCGELSGTHLTVRFDLLDKNDWDIYEVQQHKRHRLLMDNDNNMLIGKANKCQTMLTIDKFCIDWAHETGFKVTFESNDIKNEIYLNKNGKDQKRRILDITWKCYDHMSLQTCFSMDKYEKKLNVAFGSHNSNAKKQYSNLYYQHFNDDADDDNFYHFDYYSYFDDNADSAQAIEEKAEGTVEKKEDKILEKKLEQKLEKAADKEIDRVTGGDEDKAADDDKERDEEDAVEGAELEDDPPGNEEDDD